MYARLVSRVFHFLKQEFALFVSVKQLTAGLIHCAGQKIALTAFFQA
jgi:hypothetical protein